jgi:hypothetical protein
MSGQDILGQDEIDALMNGMQGVIAETPRAAGSGQAPQALS